MVKDACGGCNLSEISFKGGKRAGSLFSCLIQCDRHIHQKLRRVEGGLIYKNLACLHIRGEVTRCG